MLKCDQALTMLSLLFRLLTSIENLFLAILTTLSCSLTLSVSSSLGRWMFRMATRLPLYVPTFVNTWVRFSVSIDNCVDKLDIKILFVYRSQDHFIIHCNFIFILKYA